METFVMSRIDDHEIDCYHQYIAQTNYRLERPEDGDGMMLESREVVDKPHDIYAPVCQFTNRPHSFGDVGYRPPARVQPAPENFRMNNARNGLNALQIPSQRRPQNPRSDCGDYYYNSMPGLSNQRPMSPQAIRDRYYLKF